MMTVLYNEQSVNLEKFALLYYKNEQLRFSLDPQINHQICSHVLKSKLLIRTMLQWISILDCQTRIFYHQLLEDRPTVIPALDYWKENLHPEPIFNAKQWKTLYSLLITHKHGDVNWKIVHRGCFPLCQTDRSEISGTTQGKWNDIFRLNGANQ